MTGENRGRTNDPFEPQAVLHRWSEACHFSGATFTGTAWSDGALRLEHPEGQEAFVDQHGHATREWEYATCSTGWRELPFPAEELIPSWTALTPAGTRLRVRLRVRDAQGDTSVWYVMAHWTSDDDVVHRTTVPGQVDPFGSADVDVFVASPGRPVHAYELEIRLARTRGTSEGPVVQTLCLAASSLPPDHRQAVSAPAGARGKVLDVPRRSQEVHTGHSPQWDGGGEAWSAPACTAMLVEYFGHGPSDDETAWIDPADTAPQVDFTARAVYDYAYKGCGNWAFNAAYPARYGLRGLVTRLRSLSELERFICAGIPIATAQSFRIGELAGAGYSPAGSIKIVCGFTDDGDVVANDPLSATDEDVRRVYARGEFERVWLSASGGGGVVYLLYPSDLALPAHVPGLDPNW
ncbi:C39 family peptidase [Streptomyces sp. NBC_00233]|uniref:C39 family peptidase n=1 Tax=Streptomyces sp. NBC_00233 TaxID=2975686 RepID=UPI002256F766|nr:C39 family peptidase [Streptomyces sp. NBC_00233]